VLILDEPTAALESHEIERLFGVLGRMREQGVAIIYISHRLDEIVSLADRCTILRDGRVVAVSRRGEFDVAALVQAMTGRIGHDIHTETPSLGVPSWRRRRGREDGMRLRAGEVVGLAGLLGSGKGRVLRRLFGVEAEPARVLIKGVPKRLSNPSHAVAAGIGMVPGERGLGLIMNQSVRDNILLASLDRFASRKGFDRSAVDRTVTTLMELLDIRPRRAELKVSALSGGNQQKVIWRNGSPARSTFCCSMIRRRGSNVAAKGADSCACARFRQARRGRAARLERSWRAGAPMRHGGGAAPRAYLRAHGAHRRPR
jgi:ABC-type sugar transport system ATPase subunit